MKFFKFKEIMQIQFISENSQYVKKLNINENCFAYSFVPFV